MNTEEFYTDLLEQIRINNDSYNLPSEQSLYFIYSDFLQSSGQFVDDAIDIEYGISGYNFAAFSRDTERGALNLFLTDLKTGKQPVKLYQKDIEGYFKGLIDLVSSVLVPAKHELDESNPIREFTEDLCSESKIYKSLTIWYITNGIYSSRALPEFSGSIQGVVISMRIVDLTAYQNMVADMDQQNIEIDCSLNAIKVIETPYYTSYLTTVSGNDLARYYDQYGKRLLESNVRTFLSLRGNVNKGIYNTLRSDEKVFFFAYNMKLSVIHDKENYTLYVSKISEYANTQNKVNKSDFFSNSYFHRRFKEISKLLRIPSTGSRTISSKWFYERVKGEFLNDQMYMKESEKKKFLLDYPMDQVIDKILISKASLAWDLFPNEVSKGAQLCFAKFAEKVSDLYEEGDPDCNEYLYKKTVSQVILFKEVQKLVSGAEWYSGGYRAQTVPYLIALFSYMLRQHKMTISWVKIWTEQQIESELLAYLGKIGEAVHLKLLNPPPGNTNIGTYCKMPICWDSVKSLEAKFKTIPQFDSIISIDEDKLERKKGTQLEKLDNGIDAQVRVIDLSRTQTPKKLLEFYNSTYAPGITDLYRDVIKSWYEGKITLPTEKQAKIIIEVINKAIENGFTGIK